MIHMRSPEIWKPLVFIAGFFLSLLYLKADDTYLQLKKDLEYLDLKMTGRDLLKDRSLKPVKIAESDIDVKLSVFCEQDRILQDLEDKIRALKENKVCISFA